MDDRKDALLREAFLRIKEDMSAMAGRIEGLNDNISSLREDLAHARLNLASKDMVTGVEKEVIELAESVHTKQTIDSAVGSLDSRLHTTILALKRHESEFAKATEIKSVHKELNSINDRFLTKQELKKLFDKINKDLVYLDERLTEIEKESLAMDDMEKAFITRKELESDLDSYTKSTDKRLKELAGRLAALDESQTVAEEKSVSATEFSKLQDELAKLRVQMADREDLTELDERMSNIDESIKKGVRADVEHVLGRVTALDKENRSLGSQLKQIYSLLEKTATKENLTLVKKQVKVLYEAAQASKGLKKDVAELKKSITPRRKR
jgi:hypothetical protein